MLYTGPGSVPVPDPTALTAAAVSQASEQLRREISNLREILEAQIHGNTRSIDAAREERFQQLNTAHAEVDAAEARFSEKVTAAADASLREIERMNVAVDLKVAHLQELHETKFESVALQFKERDTRSERESRDNKVAVDAAFAAQKEAASEQNKSNTLAIDKSEKATAETLNKQADLFKSTTDALDGKIEDAKQIVNKMDTRLTAIESRGVVIRETQTQSNWGISTVIAAISALISLAALVVVLVKIG